MLESRQTLILTVAVCFAASICSQCFAENWSSFQNGGQIQFQSKTAGTDWEKGLTQKWDKSITGYGQSSPVIWDGIVYVTSVSGDNKETCYVTAYRLSTGDQIWQHEANNPSPEKNSNYVSRAAPTPVVDKQGVYALFEGGYLVALNPKGEVRWDLNLVEKYGPIKARHGIGASLEQDADSLFVWIERSENPYILRLNKSNAKAIWKSDGIGTTSWSSPRLVQVNDSHHLVLSGSGKIAGYDVESGKQLWTFDGITGNTVPTPIPAGKNRFVIGASEGRGGGDAGRAAASNGVIEIAQNPSGDWSASFVWQAKRATSSFGSPIAHNGLAYFVNRSGVVYALDVATGEERFANRISGSIWATPVVSGKNVMFFGKKGTLDVIAAGDNYNAVHSRELWQADAPAGNPFGGPTLYGVAIADQRIVIRRGDQLICLEF